MLTGALCAVNPSPSFAATEVGAGTVENTSTDLSYTGTWATASSTSDSGGSIATLNVPGSAEVTFAETSVTWVARTGNYFGIANVFLDGALVATVDLYSTGLAQKVAVYTSPHLSDSVHTLRIERTGNKNASSTGKSINVDSFVVHDSHAPAAPVGLTTTADGSSANLSWDANSEPDLAGYRIYRATGTSTSYRQLTPTPVTGTTYTDPALMPGTTYRYQIAAVDKNGSESAHSADSELESAATAAAAGTHENASGAVSLVGSWTTASSVSDSGGSIAVLGTTGYAQIAFRETSVEWVARTADSFGIANVYLDGSLVATVDLYSSALSHKKVVYKSPTLPYGLHSLRIERTGTKSDASLGKGINVDSFVVPDTRPPATLEGLSSVAEGSGSRLRWTATSDPDVAGIRVYRSSGDSTSYAHLITLAPSSTSFVDQALTPNTTYRYQVSTVDQSGNESPRSAETVVESAATSVADGVIENSSSGFITTGTWATSANRSDSGGSVSTLNTTGYAQLAFKETSVRWVARTGNYFGIARVYLDGNPVATVDLYSPTTAYKVVAYSSPTLAYGTHTLRIERTGLKNAASSGKSINVDSFVVPDSRPPSAPKALTAAAEGAGTRLNWSANTEVDLAGYRVYRAVAGSSDFEALTTEPLRGSTFIDPDLAPGSEYRYRITALDRTGNQSLASFPVTARSAVAAGTYQGDNAAISLRGAWASVPDAGASAGALHTLDSAGSASLTFNESNVRWVGSKRPDGGLARVSIDGVVVQTIDQYSPSPIDRDTLFERRGLSAGSHTITVDWTPEINEQAGSGAPQTTVDYFEVDDTTAAAPPQVVWAGASGPGIVVAWAQSTDEDASGYLLYRAEGPDGAFSQITPEPLPDTQFYDENLQPGTAYRYRVLTVDNAQNLSPFSPTASATTAVSTGTVENTASAVLFSTPWTKTLSSQDSGGSSSSLTVPGDAQLTFSGTGIRVVSRTNNYSGIAKVYLDGVAVAQVDLYSSAARYQQVVYSNLSLPDGTHTVRVERTGLKNAASAGKGISLDSFVVLDSKAPAAMPAPTLSASRQGVRISWSATASPDVAAYRLYRMGGDQTDFAQIDRVPASEREYLDIGLADDMQYSYRVTAIDTSNNESPSLAAATIRTPVTAPPVTRRYANCPAATRTVGTSSTLRSALAQAVPGDVIHLAPGTYSGYFAISARASATAPIWVCGPRTAVVDFKDVTSGYGFLLNGASHVTLTGMTIRNVQKGVTVAGASNVTVSDIRLENIGDEAIHLRSNTNDSTVIGNVIRTTGLLTPAYGEGVYIGSDPSNWCTYSACSPDRSSRNSVIDNDIAGTTAEGIEAKAGTVDGLVQGNRFDGSKMSGTHSGGWVVIKGNSWLVKGNRGVTAPQHGYQATFSKVQDWGRNNVFVANAATLNNDTGVGVWVQKYIGNQVSCDNTATEATRVTNLLCQD